ncbi:hypothetical protein K525DRAFT_274145 [Schizophyllum commune Loenen D]|nr:hypothetical protein K525DRAFT_274145 [Schizophyllum commune Loenen D]
MTQLSNPPLPAGFTPEQMQAMIAYFMQNQGVLPGAAVTETGSTSSGTATSTASSSAEVSNAEDDIVMRDRDGQGGPPTPMQTPPRRKSIKAPPATPRAPGNPTSSSGALPSSAANTPSLKMAQLTLDGRKVPSTPTTKGKRRRSASASTPKGPVPTGHDPNLIFKDADTDDAGKNAAGAESSSKEDDKEGKDEESDPYEGFPAVVTLPDAKKAVDESNVKETPKSASTRRKRSEPTTARWMNTRRTRTSSESSPPAVQTSPKKKARIISPTVSPVPSPSSGSKRSMQERMASPFQSPNQETAGEIRALKRILESVRSGAKLPSLAPLLQEARAADLLDSEAEDSDGEGDEEDENGNLEGFVVDDDVVEYDETATYLPDEEERPEPRRLYRRNREDANEKGDHKSDGDASDIEIVPTPNKGKARAPPPPPSPPPATQASSSRARRPAEDLLSDSGATAEGGAEESWKNRKIDPANCTRGLHPGSTALDENLSVCDKLMVDDTPFSFEGMECDFLRELGFYEHVPPVPGDCAYVLSNFNDDGWGTPSMDVVAVAETHVHTENLKRGTLFRRQGPYINPAQVNADDIAAVTVSQPHATPRYKVMVKESRAPAVSLTSGIVRYWRLDTPNNGSHPVKYLNMTSFEGLFDRSFGLNCMVLGQSEVNCITFNNAIRYSTLPVFERPGGAAPTNKTKASSSIRRAGNLTQPSRRAAPFELSTNDTIPVYDATKTVLPHDISTWQTVLPLWGGSLPRNAVAYVAHTTNMWVGTRSTTSPTSTSHNIQFNLVFQLML